MKITNLALLFDKIELQLFTGFKNDNYLAEYCEVEEKLLELTGLDRNYY